MLSSSIYKTRPVTTRSSIQSQFIGVHISPLLHSFFNFSRSHPIWFIHGSIYNLGRFLFLSTYQRKKTTTTSTTKQKANKIDVNVQTCHFVQANEITAVGFVALTNRILALRLHFVQVQIYCCWRSVTLLNMPYSIFASFQRKVSLNGNFPYRFLIVIEKYQI